MTTPTRSSPLLPRAKSPGFEEFLERQKSLFNWTVLVHCNLSASSENMEILRFLADAVPQVAVSNKEVTDLIAAVKQVVVTRKFDPSLKDCTNSAMNSLSRAIARL